ncbi:MAG: SDR family oxidoreductase [Candidatus Handelsmanbacteria bacterium]|nr:SDR family oxidoreductase [Candidatus Handelsmanbacteria bacterium]
MGKLSGKVALVTGANQGIGKGIARGLGKEGAKLVISARNADKLEQVAAEFGKEGIEAVAVPADVGEEAQVVALFEKAAARYGRLDVLFNNAGAFDGGPVENLSLEAWNRVLSACLTGAFLCTREAFNIMKPQGGGRIINIGSISAQRARMHSAPYTSAKFGVWGLTQATALEGRQHGIVVSCLHPGNVLVERRQQENLGGMREDGAEPMMTVEELAEVAVHMATLPGHVNFLEAIVLPTTQLYLGRG